MELWEAVYIAKNLKGLYLPGEVGNDREITVLRKRFRYRKVGILRSDYEKLGDSAGEPLHPIDPEIIHHHIEYRSIPDNVANILSLSSFFMMPILASPLLRDDLEKLFTWSLRLPRPLTAAEFRFNLRLLTYMPVDMASRAAAKLKEVTPAKKLDQYAKTRSAEIIRDAEKRFWRLKEDVREGLARLGIINPLEYLSGLPEEKDLSFLLPSGVMFIEEK